MRRFHHVGVNTDEPQPDEIYAAETRVHVTNPADHPYRVAYLRIEPQSPVTGPVRDLPDVALVVEDLDAEVAGERVLLGPTRAMGGVRVVFVWKGGVVIELRGLDGAPALDRPCAGEGPARSAVGRAGSRGCAARSLDTREAVAGWELAGRWQCGSGAAARGASWRSGHPALTRRPVSRGVQTASRAVAVSQASDRRSDSSAVSGPRTY
jgi:hypothetical protein